MSVYFNGELLALPGAYSAIDATGMSVKVSDTASKVIAFVGESGGGEPGALQLLSDPVTAKKVLKSGDLLDACNRAWNPVTSSKEGVPIGGANLIACIRTNRATKGSMTVKSGTNTQMVIESKDWNADANNIEIRMTAKSDNAKVFDMIVHDHVNDVYETHTNIGGLFILKYTGTEAYCEMNIVKTGTGTSATEMYLQTKVGDDAESAVEDIKIQLRALDKDVLKSMQVLISTLRAYENYEVTTIDGYNMSTKCGSIDPVSGVDIKSGNGTVTAFYADLATKLTRDSEMIQVKEYSQDYGLPAPFDYTYLTGGSDGTTPASWVGYFDQLSNYNISYIVPLTGDRSIHAELFAHVKDLSGSKGRERRMIVGGEIGETLDNTINRAKLFCNARVQVVHGGFYDYDANSNLTLYAPYILAAQHAGRCAHLDDGESATHDTYAMASPEYKLGQSDVKQCLDAGVVCFEFVLRPNTVNGSYVRLVHDLTTDTVNSDNSVYAERATGELADSINKEIREKIDRTLTGKRSTIYDLTAVKNAVLTILLNRKIKGQIIEYKGVYVTKTGTVTTVDYSVAPSEPNNFTLITAHYYSQTISAE